jgi:trimethylguanosine synthase
MQPYNLEALMTSFQALTKEIVLYLPRTSDVRQLAAWHTGDGKLWVTHYCMKGASKALCAFYGSLSEMDG